MCLVRKFLSLYLFYIIDENLYICLCPSNFVGLNDFNNYFHRNVRKLIEDKF